MLLAIDTATRTAGVALHNADGVQALISWRSRENHTVELTPQISNIMKLAKVEKKDLGSIAVALGPGSFTGLRVGMSVAKGLAFALSIPLIGIPTLDAIAHAHLSQTMPIYSILAAGRGRYSMARYEYREGASARFGDYPLMNADNLVQIVAHETLGSDSKVLFCGEIDSTLEAAIQSSLQAKALVASPAQNACRVGLLAELAWDRFQRGKFDNVASLAPIYTATGG
jgi:tRNA threonylcarbamoyladenosine biosynthesis protein TsaB